MIRNILHDNSLLFLKGLVLLRPNYTTLFNKYQFNKMKMSNNNLNITDLINIYQGYDYCGESVFMVKNILNKYDINTNVYNTSNKNILYINDDYITDHCILYINDDIIIDPSIRQLLLDNRSDEILDCKYRDFIFNEVEPFFIGTIEEYYDLLELCNNLNKKIYGEPYINLFKLISFCNFNINIDNKFTLDYFSENHYDFKNYYEIKELFN
jgi:hypothetical protein